MTWPSPSSLENVSDHQREQYALIANSGSRIAILNGGPGTGKTYTAAAIVKQLPPSQVSLSARTGKAAIRFSQLMREHDVTLGARTIHSVLGTSRTKGGGFAFYHGPGNPLPSRYFVIDECSMVETAVAAAMLLALPEDAIVLLVGDIGQLLPVGHGAPMRDMIRAGVPTATLTEIRRTSGDMAIACKAMAEGKFEPSTGRDVDAGQNWWHIDSRSPEKTRSIIVSFLQRRLPGEYSYDDVQVLCLVNDKSPKLGRVALNELIAPICNPARIKNPPLEEWLFSRGDKVMCLKNGHYFLVVQPEPEPEPEPDDDVDPFEATRKVIPQVSEFVANGEIGYVSECNRGECHVWFDNPEREVRFIGTEMYELTLAYAITVHKSQGSQWPIVILPIDDHSSAKWLSCRELLYTAISRQQVLTITIGQAGVAKRALQKVRINDRKTFLKEDLVK